MAERLRGCGNLKVGLRLRVLEGQVNMARRKMVLDYLVTAQ
jgi:hypothetical protein